MEKDKIVLIALVVIVIGIIILINHSKSNENQNNENLECISQNSFLIVSKTCSHCANQLRILRNSKNKFNISYIDENPGILEKYNLQGVPTWIINKRSYLGVRSISELKELTGC